MTFNFMAIKVAVGEIFPYVTFGFIIFTIFMVIVYLRYIPHWTFLDIFYFIKYKILNESSSSFPGRENAKSKFFKISLLFTMGVLRYVFLSEFIRFGIRLGIVAPYVLTPFKVFVGVFGVFLMEVGLFAPIILLLSEIIFPAMLNAFVGTRVVHYLSMFSLIDISVRKVSHGTVVDKGVYSRSKFYPNLEYGKNNARSQDSKFGIPPRKGFARARVLNENNEISRISIRETTLYPKTFEKDHKICLPKLKDDPFGEPKEVISSNDLTKKLKKTFAINIIRALSIGAIHSEYIDIFKTDVGAQNYFQKGINQIFNLKDPLITNIHDVKNLKGVALVEDLITELSWLKNLPEIAIEEKIKSGEVEDAFDAIIRRHFPNANQMQLFQLLVSLNNGMVDFASMAVYPYESLRCYKINTKVQFFSDSFINTMLNARINWYIGKNSGKGVPSAIFDFLISTENGLTAFEAKSWHKDNFEEGGKIKFESREEVNKIFGVITSSSFSVQNKLNIVVNDQLLSSKPQYPLGVRVPFEINAGTSFADPDFKKIKDYCTTLVGACKKEGITSVGILHTFNSIDCEFSVDNPHLQSWVDEFGAEMDESNGVIMIKFDPLKTNEAHLAELDKYKYKNFPNKKELTEKEIDKLAKIENSILQTKFNSEFFNMLNSSIKESGAHLKVEYKILIDNRKRTISFLFGWFLLVMYKKWSQLFFFSKYNIV